MQMSRAMNTRLPHTSSGERGPAGACGRGSLAGRAVLAGLSVTTGAAGGGGGGGSDGLAAAALEAASARAAAAAEARAAASAARSGFDAAVAAEAAALAGKGVGTAGFEPAPVGGTVSGYSVIIGGGGRLAMAEEATADAWASVAVDAAWLAGGAAPFVRSPDDFIIM